jgi:hypothetical protein
VGSEEFGGATFVLDLNPTLMLSMFAELFDQFLFQDPSVSTEFMPRLSHILSPPASLPAPSGAANAYV